MWSSYVIYTAIYIYIACWFIINDLMLLIYIYMLFIVGYNMHYACCIFIYLVKCMFQIVGWNDGFKKGLANGGWLAPNWGVIDIYMSMAWVLWIA